MFKKLKLSGNCDFNHLFEEAATIYVVLVHDGVEHHLKYTTALYSHNGNQIRVGQIEEDIINKITMYDVANITETNGTFPIQLSEVTFSKH